MSLSQKVYVLPFLSAARGSTAPRVCLWSVFLQEQTPGQLRFARAGPLTPQPGQQGSASAFEKVLSVAHRQLQRSECLRPSAANSWLGWLVASVQYLLGAGAQDYQCLSLQAERAISCGSPSWQAGG